MDLIHFFNLLQKFLFHIVLVIFKIQNLDIWHFSSIWYIEMLLKMSLIIFSSNMQSQLQQILTHLQHNELEHFLSTILHQFAKKCHPKFFWCCRIQYLEYCKPKPINIKFTLCTISELGGYFIYNPDATVSTVFMFFYFKSYWLIAAV